VTDKAPQAPPGPAVWPRSPLLLCASSSRTGPVEGLLALGTWLRARGIDARFAGDTVRPGEQLDEHLARAGVPWVRELRLSRKVRIADVLHDARSLRDWVRSGNPDLLHSSFPHDHLISLWAARGVPGVRVFRTAHRRRDIEPGFRIRALRWTDGVLVHSNAYRESLIAQGLPEERVAAIAGGVDSARFSPGPALDFRERWGVPAAAPLAGIVARMKPERGHRALLHAFARAAPPDAWLVLVGRGEEEEPLRALARELGEPGRRIVFGGYARGDDLISAYRALDLAIWLREGNDGACRGVLEAMACGLPLITGNDGAPPELLGDSATADTGCGRVVDPNSIDAIGAALRELLADLPLARTLGAAARARAALFTQDHFAASVLDFWRRTAALPRVSSPRG
jgi:glycosyltransferase involved in cell wall biosynthesis